MHMLMYKIDQYIRLKQCEYFWMMHNSDEIKSKSIGFEGGKKEFLFAYKKKSEAVMNDDRRKKGPSNFFSPKFSLRCQKSFVRYLILTFYLSTFIYLSMYLSIYLSRSYYLSDHVSIHLYLSSHLAIFCTNLCYIKNQTGYILLYSCRFF